MKLGIGKRVKNGDSEHYSNIDSLDEFIAHEPAKADLLVCECSCVSLETITQFLEELPSSTLEDLKRSLKVGIGCGSCVKSYKFLSSRG